MTLSLSQLRVLCRQATPGPWRVSMSGYSVKSHDVDVPIVAAVHTGASARAIDIERWLPNADFIAAARTAVPSLLDRLEQAERELNGYRETEGTNAVCFDKVLAERTALELELKQRDRDWDALVTLIAKTVGTEEDREAAEMGEMEEFDPWRALRTHRHLQRAKGER